MNDLSPEKLSENKNFESIKSTNLPQIKLSNFEVLFRDSVRLWWKNFSKIFDIYLETLKIIKWPMLIGLVIFIASYFITQVLGLSTASVLTIITFISIIVYIPLLVYSIYYFFRANMAVYLLVRDNFSSQPKQLVLDTKAMFRSYLGVTILSSLLIGIWSLLLIIPGIIFAVLYSLSSYVFFSENKKGMEALNRSRFLVKGYFWPLFSRFLPIILLYFILGLILQIPLELVANANFVSVYNIFTQMVNVLLAPILIIFTYRIYNELVIIKK